MNSFLEIGNSSKRFQGGWGGVEQDVKAVMRREVIAWLAVEDMGHSIVKERVLPSIFSESLLNEVRPSVALVFTSGCTDQAFACDVCLYGAGAGGS